MNVHDANSCVAYVAEVITLPLSNARYGYVNVHDANSGVAYVSEVITLTLSNARAENMAERM